jgi:antitoxin HicB
VTRNIAVRPLTEDEGGGYLVEFPDLPGCMSDGETIEEAIANGEDAKCCWIAAMAADPARRRSSRPKATVANRSFALRNRSTAGLPNAPSAKG